MAGAYIWRGSCYHKLYQTRSSKCIYTGRGFPRSTLSTGGRVGKDPEDESDKQTTQVVYRTALMEGGFLLNDLTLHPVPIYLRLHQVETRHQAPMPPSSAEEEDGAAEEAEAETETKEPREEEEASAFGVKGELHGGLGKCSPLFCRENILVEIYNLID